METTPLTSTQPNPEIQTEAFTANRPELPNSVLLKEKLLSAREQEILRFIAKGKTSKEISALFGLSVFTINKHRENMMRKTGSKNSSEVLAFSYQFKRATGEF